MNRNAIGWQRNLRRFRLEYQLQKEVGRTRFRELCLFTPDVRDMPARAAEVLQLPIEELSERIAARMGLPYMPRVRPAAPGRLTFDVRLDEWRALGAICVEGPVGRAAVCCIDPARVIASGCFPRELSIWIGTWERIERGLKVVENQLSEAPLRESPVRSGDEAADAVIDALLNEMRVHSGVALKVDLDHDEGIRCSLRCEDGRQGSLWIKRDLREALLRRLQALTGGLEPLEGTDRRYRILEGESEGEFVLVPDQLPGREERPSPAVACETDSPGMQQHSYGSLSNAFDERNTELEQPFLSGKQVVVVEDSPEFRKVLCRFLGRMGASIVEFSDAESLLTELERGTLEPDLLITDVHLPSTSGIELLRRLRCGGAAWFPVIGLTSDGDADVEVELIREGAAACLKKNEDPRILGAYAARILNSTEVCGWPSS